MIPPTASRGDGLLGLERDYIAETFQSASEIGRGAGLVDLVKVCLSQLPVPQPFGEHVIRRNEDLMGDGRPHEERLGRPAGGNTCP